MNGRVIEALNGRCTVITESGCFDCGVKGVFRKKSFFPKAGDYAEIEIFNEKEGNIVKILTRKNEFIRPMVSNIDKMFIVSSLSSPPPVLENIDKMTVICEYKNVEPIIVFTKNDLADAEFYENIYNSAGYKTLTLSNKSDVGTNEILELIKGNTVAFTGFSGVGKSSLINKICPEALSEVGELSDKSQRGKNTTRRTTMFECNGGFLADTPGFSSLDLLMCVDCEKEEIKNFFPEIAAFNGECKFSDCLHLEETKGCAVINALKEGKIAPSRYENYLKFYKIFSEKRKF